MQFAAFLSAYVVITIADDSILSTTPPVSPNLCEQNITLAAKCTGLNSTAYSQCYQDYFRRLKLNYTTGRLPELMQFGRNVMSTMLRFRGSQLFCNWQDQLSICTENCFEADLYKVLGETSEVSRVAYTAVERVLNNLCQLPTQELNTLVTCIARNFTRVERGVRECFANHSKHLMQCSTIGKFISCGTDLIREICGTAMEPVMCDTASIVYETIKCPLKLYSCYPIEAACHNPQDSSTSTENPDENLSTTTTAEISTSSPEVATQSSDTAAKVAGDASSRKMGTFYLYLILSLFVLFLVY